MRTCPLSAGGGGSDQLATPGWAGAGLDPAWKRRLKRRTQGKREGQSKEEEESEAGRDGGGAARQESLGAKAGGGAASGHAVSIAPSQGP